MKGPPAHFKPNELLRDRVSVFTISYALLYLFVLLLVVGHNYETTYVNVVMNHTSTEETTSWNRNGDINVHFHMTLIG